MRVATTFTSARKTSKKVKPAAHVLYLYGISQVPKRDAYTIVAEGIDGRAPVEEVRCEGYLCWISRVSKIDFADHIAEHMQDLEWLASAGLRHQRAVAEISSKLPTLPARFGTVFLSDISLARHVKARKRALVTTFERVAGADEWGVKIFALAARQRRDATPPRSGAEYLKAKAKLLEPRAAGKLDEEVRSFIGDLSDLAIAASPGGKASAGQAGLIWHGSFLIRAKDRKRLDSALRRYARRWKDVRRIDFSGPWPPYSFVGEDGE